ncbi:MAG: hypothetical protein IT466_01910 [Moraxellaceae bacterium]|nr:hypothetical protein [Moraxellaceae bacterium]HQV42190.1 hypothetical protein [Moraxellaceae bacterium]
MFKIIAAALSIASLSGCASMISDPVLRDGLSHPKLTKLDDQVMADKVGFLAGDLLGVDSRNKLRARLANEKWVKTEVDFLVANAIASGVLQANPFNAGGQKLAGDIYLALKVIDILGPDGSLDEIGAFYLPHKVDSYELDSAESARDFSWQYSEAYLNKAAHKINGSVSCAWQCDSKTSRVYEISRRPLEGQYIYNPENIYVYINTKDFEEVKPDPLRDVSLGFMAKWHSGPGRSWSVSYWGRARKTEQGKIADAYDEKDRRSYPYLGDRIEETTIFRDIAKAATDDAGYMIWGSRKITPAIVAFKGELFNFTLRSHSRFIDSKVVMGK